MQNGQVGGIGEGGGGVEGRFDIALYIVLNKGRFRTCTILSILGWQTLVVLSFLFSRNVQSITMFMLKG